MSGCWKKGSWNGQAAGKYFEKLTSGWGQSLETKEQAIALQKR